MCHLTPSHMCVCVCGPLVGPPRCLVSSATALECVPDVKHLMRPAKRHFASYTLDIEGFGGISAHGNGHQTLDELHEGRFAPALRPRPCPGGSQSTQMMQGVSGGQPRPKRQRATSLSPPRFTTSGPHHEGLCARLAIEMNNLAVNTTLVASRACSYGGHVTPICLCLSWCGTALCHSATIACCSVCSVII